jgi:serine/threonine protein kinase
VLEREDHHQVAFSQWPTKLCCLIGIASAVRFVHSKHLVHSDLKCENVMVRLRDGTYNAVLGDFGSACDSQSWDSRRGPVGTIRFMAPELHSLEKTDLGQPSPVKADVFSFAFIMWILVSDVEYPDPVTKEQVRKFTLNPWIHGSGERADLATKEDICNGKRPNCRGEKNRAWYAYYNLIDACWSQVPDERPDFDIIEEILASLAVGCACNFRGSKDSQAKSGTCTVLSSPQTLLRNPDLVEALTKSTNELQNKFGCTWQDYLAEKVDWKAHQNRYYMRTLNLAERNSWSDVDTRLKKEVLLHVSRSGLGQNLHVFEGEDAMWALEKITALRDSHRCVYTVLALDFEFIARLFRQGSDHRCMPKQK